MSTELIIIIAIALTILYGIMLYNRLVSLRQNRKNAFSDIDVQLKQRFDLVPALVETVKGFAGQEHKVLKDVIDSRARAMESVGNARLTAETQIGQSLNSLFAISENYPDLASSTHFRELRSEMTRIEDRITAARRFYNLAVEELNGIRRAFPGNLIALVSTIKRHEKFSLGDRRGEFAEPVKVTF